MSATSTATAATTATPAEEEMGRWEIFPSMIAWRQDFGAAADGDRLLYAVGGNGSITAEVWDATTKEWTALPDMNVERWECAAAVINGNLYAIGGEDGTVHDSVSVYDPNTRSWTDLPSMHTGRYGCAAAAVGGKLFVFGGYDGDGVHLASAEMFDTASGRWSNIPDMSVRREGCAAAVIGDRIYVVGGDDGSGDLDSIEVFHPRSKAWSSDPVPPMSCGRSGLAAAGWEDRLYVFGGCDEQGEGLRSAEVFDIGEGTWTRLPDMDSARRGCAAAIVGGKIVLMGGLGGGGTCEAYAGHYLQRIDPIVAAALPRRPKEGLLQIMMVARRLDDERARRGEGDVGPDLWWRIVGMLKVGDLG